MPDRALPLVQSHQRPRDFKAAVQKQKCPTGHYHLTGRPSASNTGNSRSKNKNARQGITTFHVVSHLHHKSHKVQKQKCPTGHYHSYRRRFCMKSSRSKNKNARQGITTPLAVNRSSVWMSRPKTKMPDRALPRKSVMALWYARRLVQKQKCPTGHYHSLVPQKARPETLNR